MKQVRKLSQIMVGFFLLGIFGCGPNPGIEVGNPKLAGKVVTLQAPDSDDTYIIQFLTDTSAQVSKVVENQFEIVSAVVSVMDGQVQVVADFAAGPHFEAQLEVDDSGNILSATLSLDNASVPVTVEVKNEKKSVDPFFSNEALTIVSSLCGRIAECQPSTLSADCEAAVVEVPGLAQEFGGAPGQSLKQEGLQLDNGDVAVDADALAQCMDEMEILPCQQVEKGHDPATPEDYHKVRHLIPKPSCTKVFSNAH